MIQGIPTKANICRCNSGIHLPNDHETLRSLDRLSIDEVYNRMLALLIELDADERITFGKLSLCIRKSRIMGLNERIHLRIQVKNHLGVGETYLKQRTSSITPSSNSLPSSLSSSSSLASSIANGVRSMRATALAAWSIGGTGENKEEGNEDDERLLSIESCDSCEVVAVTEVWLSVVVRLALDAERRIVGVSNDSRALGSSSVVNLPIAGRYNTFRNRAHQPIMNSEERKKNT